EAAGGLKPGHGGGQRLVVRPGVAAGREDEAQLAQASARFRHGRAGGAGAQDDAVEPNEVRSLPQLCEDGGSAGSYWCMMFLRASCRRENRQQSPFSRSRISPARAEQPWGFSRARNGTINPGAPSGCGARLEAEASSCAGAVLWLLYC